MQGMKRINKRIVEPCPSPKLYPAPKMLNIDERAFAIWKFCSISQTFFVGGAGDAARRKPAAPLSLAKTPSGPENAELQ
jgi:hypothetical protein